MHILRSEAAGTEDGGEENHTRDERSCCSCITYKRLLGILSSCYDPIWTITYLGISAVSGG